MNKNKIDKVCPNCGKRFDNDSDISFCSKCGTKLIEKIHKINLEEIMDEVDLSGKNYSNIITMIGEKDFLDAIIRYDKNKFKISCKIFDLEDMDTKDDINYSKILLIYNKKIRYTYWIYKLTDDAFTFLINNGIELDVEEKIKILINTLKIGNYPPIIKERIEKLFNPDIDTNNNNESNRRIKL